MDINWSTINLLATHIIINVKKIVHLECILSLILFLILFFRFITVFKIRYRIQINWFFCINRARKKRNPRQIKSNVNDTLNDADNFENFEDTCINTAIDTISATIASTSKNGNSDCIIAFRAPSSALGKVTLMVSTTFDACKLLILLQIWQNTKLLL